MEEKLTYFVSDVHLGLNVKDPDDREKRFASFLNGLPQNTEAVYLLGDIWDFWYEYKDVVPKGYIRVFAALESLIDRGVKVYFFQGNHDVWTYAYFEELGMIRMKQPALVEISGKKFCLGHGDGLGPTPLGYRMLRSVFHCRFLQFMFSLLHPWIAFRFGNNWSKSNRLARSEEYEFKGEQEPLYLFAKEFAKTHDVDYFIFGHYHVDVNMRLGKAEFRVLKDWIDGDSYLYFSGMGISGGYFPKSEK